MTPERTKEEILRLRIMYDSGFAVMNGLQDEIYVRKDIALEAMEEYLRLGTSPVESKWVKVSERLPEIGVNVLLFTGLDPTDDFMIGSLKTIVNGTPWFWDEEANFFSVPVTHWQPLPSPPELPIEETKEK